MVYFGSQFRVKLVQHHFEVLSQSIILEHCGQILFVLLIDLIEILTHCGINLPIWSRFIDYANFQISITSSSPLCRVTSKKSISNVFELFHHNDCLIPIVCSLPDSIVPVFSVTYLTSLQSPRSNQSSDYFFKFIALMTLRNEDI